jgi:hypothetical protein
MTPIPLHPLLETAKTGWGKAEFFMRWFSKLVTMGYGWTDGIIKARQNKANNSYKMAKAEKEALRIMEEQRREREASVVKNLGKREYVVDEELLDLDFKEFNEFLEMLENTVE